MNRIILIAFLALAIPQITFAAWWNPFSWFGKQKATVFSSATSTGSVQTSSELDELRKEIELLKKQLEVKKITTETKASTKVTESKPSVATGAVKDKLVISDLRAVMVFDAQTKNSKLNLSWTTNFNSDALVKLSDDGVYKREKKSESNYFHEIVFEDLPSDRSYSYEIVAASENGPDVKKGSIDTQKLQTPNAKLNLLDWPTLNTRLQFTLMYEDKFPAINYPISIKIIDVTDLENKKTIFNGIAYTDSSGVYNLPLKANGGDQIVDVIAETREKSYEQRVKLRVQ